MREVPNRKILRQIILFSLVVFLIAPIISPTAAQGIDVLVSEDVETYLTQTMENGEIPTIQVGIIEDGELRYARGFGEQTSLDNVFPIGSVQKMFVAMAVLQVYEDGLLDLDADVNDYLPFILTHPRYQNISITPRLLLYHRSGLVSEMYYTFCWDTKGVFYPELKSVYNSEIIKMSLADFCYATLASEGEYYWPNSVWDFEPDTQYGYSSVGYQVLMYLVELVSGMLFPDFVQANILDPLNMTHTGFNVSALEHHAAPHIRYNGTNREVSVWEGNYVIRSNVQDVFKFLLVHMNQGSYGEVQILEPTTVEMMREIGSAYGGTLYGLSHRGYGMAVHSYEGDVYGHSGSSIGGIMTVFFSPSKQKGLIFMSNLNHVCSYNMDDVEFVNKYFNEANEYLLKVSSLAPAISERELIIIACISIVVLGISYNSYNFWKKRSKTNQAQI